MLEGAALGVLILVVLVLAGIVAILVRQDNEARRHAQQVREAAERLGWAPPETARHKAELTGPPYRLVRDDHTEIHSRVTGTFRDLRSTIFQVRHRYVKVQPAFGIEDSWDTVIVLHLPDRLPRFEVLPHVQPPGVGGDDIRRLGRRTHLTGDLAFDDTYATRAETRSLALAVLRPEVRELFRQDLRRVRIDGDELITWIPGIAMTLLGDPRDPADRIIDLLGRLADMYALVPESVWDDYRVP